MKQNCLPVEDIYLAAALATLCFREPEYQVEGSQVTFLFSADLDLSRAIGHYYNDGEMPARSYSSWLTRLNNEVKLHQKNLR